MSPMSVVICITSGLSERLILSQLRTHPGSLTGLGWSLLPELFFPRENYPRETNGYVTSVSVACENQAYNQQGNC